MAKKPISSGKASTRDDTGSSYESMLEQVETLVNDVSDPQMPLDTLVAKVETGYDLIKAMRERLSQTQVKLEELRDGFLESAADDATATKNNDEDESDDE